jgi:hypothetical protein
LLVETAKAVIARWCGGDLASAVRALDAALENKTKEHSQTPPGPGQAQPRR